jgi:hypothetical protein
MNKNYKLSSDENKQMFDLKNNMNKKIEYFYIFFVVAAFVICISMEVI